MSNLLNGVTIHETHYDFSPLIEALQTYVNHYDNWYATNDLDAIKNQWSKVVELVQRYLPAHVAQHYCDPDESFAPTHQFNKKTFKRTLEFYNFITNKREFWFAPVSSTSGLGALFDISVVGHVEWVMVVRDLAAMTALCEVRTLDLVPLMQRLEGPIQKPSKKRCRS